MNTPIIQAQFDLVDKLLSEAALVRIPAVALRKLVLSQEASARLPHLLGRQPVIPGPEYVGAGVVVNMPERTGILPNISPPQAEWNFSFDVIENPELNFGSNGTQISAEDISESVLTCVHNFQIEGLGLFQQAPNAIQPLTLPPHLTGCLGYRVFVLTRISQANALKSTLPQISHDHGQLFFTGADPGAVIYYTIDGSFPGSGNPAALIWNQNNPPNVGPGVTVRYSAYTPGALGSDAALGTTD